MSVVLFAAAGALGAGVADRLDPYGADDPDTESVSAEQRLEEAGYRETSVVVLIEGVDPQTEAGASASTGRRGGPRGGRGEGRHRLRRDPLARVRRERRRLHLPRRRLLPTDDGERQDAATGHRLARRRARRARRRQRRRPARRSTSKVESDLQRAELSPSRSSSCSRCSSSAASSRRALPLLVGGLAIVGTFLMLTVASASSRSISIFALNLVTGLGLGLAIDYSLFMVSRYREEIAKTGPGIEAMRATMATAGRTVLFSSLTVAAALAALLRLPAALPLLDGARRSAGRADRGRDLADRAAGGARAARQPRQLARARLPPAPRRARRAPADEGFWYRLSRS